MAYSADPDGRVAMAGDQEAVAQEEADARYANESLEKSHEYLEEPEPLQIVCECGRPGCGEIVTITTVEYEELRSDPTHFAVYKEHVLPDVERVIRETDRFVVVAKRPGTPAEVAREEDPRS